MAEQEQEHRNFAEVVSIDDDGETEEGGTYSGRTPRQAAMKIARRLDPVEVDTEEEAWGEMTEEVMIREKGTSKVHIYEGTAWTHPPVDGAPDWLGDEVTDANLRKQGIQHLDE